MTLPVKCPASDLTPIHGAEVGSDATQLSARLGEKPSKIWPPSQNQPIRVTRPQAYILMEHFRYPFGIKTTALEVFLDLVVAKEQLGKSTPTYHRSIQIVNLDTEVRS